MKKEQNSVNLVWHPNAEKEFKKLNILGSGSYGSVWLAKPKHEINNKEVKEYRVAIKCIKVNDKLTESYAAREISILKEVNHPNCINLIKAYDTYNNTRCLVLTLADGPSLEILLRSRGAFGIPLASMVHKQLIETVAYLHSNSIIHRDLKPDNCILVGGDIKDDAIWSDGDDANRAVANSRWNIKLIDFGFARALSHKELLRDSEKDEFSSKIDLPFSMSKKKKESKIVIRTVNSLKKIRQKVKVMNLSKDSLEITRSKDVLEMSAIGSCGYAAPEIFQSLRKNSCDINRSSTEVTSLANKVADYSMSADAFSLGCVLRYIWTGVPANCIIEEFVSKERKKKSQSSFSIKKSSINRKKLRYYSELPKPIASIIRRLRAMHVKDRLSVRSCFRRLIETDCDLSDKQLLFSLDSFCHLECAGLTK